MTRIHTIVLVAIAALLAACTSAAPSVKPDQTATASVAASATEEASVEATASPEPSPSETSLDLEGLRVELLDVALSGTTIDVTATPTAEPIVPTLLRSLGQITNERTDEAAVVVLDWTAYADADGVIELPDQAVEDVLDTRGAGITIRPTETVSLFVRAGEPELFIEPTIASLEWHPLPDGFSVENSTFDIHLRYTFTDDPTTLEGATADSPADVDLTFTGCILHVVPNADGSGGQAVDCTPVGPMVIPAGETVEVPLAAETWAALGGMDAQDGVVGGDYGLSPLMNFSGDQPALFD